MNSSRVELKVVKENRNNPRKIRSEKLFTLVRSILTLPKMLELRPLVVDDKYTIMGGNMRYKALNIISQMSAEEIEKEIFSIVYDYKTNAEKRSLVEYWKNWTANPVVTIVKADELSPEEKKQFIVKDNVNYGQWDEDLLQGFDKFLLGEMGVMEWKEIQFEQDKQMIHDICFNCNSSEKRAKFDGMTMADYMRYLWNNPQNGQSPYKLFEGALIPAGKDKEGNLIYQYNGATF